MTRRTAKHREDAPKMTAHHFEFIAYVLGELPTYPTGVDADQLAAIASVVAGHLKRTNPRFDADVFIDAVLHG